jgi:type I restriction enzyme, S subunit
VRDFHGNDPRFISYLLRTIDFRTHSGKSGVPGVNRNDLHEIKVSLPADRIQQKVVAEALSDADALVESLEQLLTKKRGVKQAAMQVLLTGKKRLKGFGANVSYRQTEAGMIPDDWEVRQLGEVTTFLDGKRRPVKDGDRAKMRGSIPYYGASGIVDYVNNYLFDEDLILLGEDGENIISRNTRLAFRISGKTWVNNHAHVLRPKPTVCIGFLTDYLESLNFERFNSGTAQPKLNKQTCYAIPLALPSSHAEQEAVALILSDVDREIAATEARLGKARAVKQGMMQELLTGRTHLV